MPRVDDHLDELGARSRELEGHLFLFGGRFDMEGWDSGGKVSSASLAVTFLNYLLL